MGRGEASPGRRGKAQAREGRGGATARRRFGYTAYIEYIETDPLQSGEQRKSNDREKKRPKKLQKKRRNARQRRKWQTVEGSGRQTALPISKESGNSSRGRKRPSDTDNNVPQKKRQKKLVYSGSRLAYQHLRQPFKMEETRGEELVYLQDLRLVLRAQRQLKELVGYELAQVPQLPLAVGGAHARKLGNKPPLVVVLIHLPLLSQHPLLRPLGKRRLLRMRTASRQCQRKKLVFGVLGEGGHRQS